MFTRILLQQISTQLTQGNDPFPLLPTQSNSETGSQKTKCVCKRECYNNTRLYLQVTTSTRIEKVHNFIMNLFSINEKMY